jgi:hypothetical protein
MTGFWSWGVMWFRLSGLDPVERWVFSISANLAVAVFKVNDFVRRLVALCSSYIGLLLRHIALRETCVRAIQPPPPPATKAINVKMATGRLESPQHSAWPSPEESRHVMTVIHKSVLHCPPVLKNGYSICIDSSTDNAQTCWYCNELST